MKEKKVINPIIASKCKLITVRPAALVAAQLLSGFFDKKKLK
jgi:hypothetical protein